MVPHRIVRSTGGSRSTWTFRAGDGGSEDVVPKSLETLLATTVVATEPAQSPGNERVCRPNLSRGDALVPMCGMQDLVYGCIQTLLTRPAAKGDDAALGAGWWRGRSHVLTLGFRRSRPDKVGHSRAGPATMLLSLWLCPARVCIRRIVACGLFMV